MREIKPNLTEVLNSYIGDNHISSVEAYEVNTYSELVGHAAKLARREGIDFVLDPMWAKIDDELFEHIDGLKSTIDKPPFIK